MFVVKKEARRNSEDVIADLPPQKKSFFRKALDVILSPIWADIFLEIHTAGVM